MCSCRVLPNTFLSALSTPPHPHTRTHTHPHAPTHPHTHTPTLNVAQCHALPHQPNSGMRSFIGRQAGRNPGTSRAQTSTQQWIPCRRWPIWLVPRQYSHLAEHAPQVGIYTWSLYRRLGCGTRPQATLRRRRCGVHSAAWRLLRLRVAASPHISCRRFRARCVEWHFLASVARVCVAKLSVPPRHGRPALALLGGRS